MAAWSMAIPGHFLLILHCNVLLVYFSPVCCAVLCCAVLCCAVLCCAVLCCAVLCHDELCHAVLCRAVLCCAMLCCAVPCCAVQCFSLVTNELGQIRAVPLYASGAAYVHMLQVLAMSKLVHAGQDSLGKLQMALCTF